MRRSHDGRSGIKAEASLTSPQHPGDRKYRDEDPSTTCTSHSDSGTRSVSVSSFYSVSSGGSDGPEVLIEDPEYVPPGLTQYLLTWLTAPPPRRKREAKLEAPSYITRWTDSPLHLQCSERASRWLCFPSSHVCPVRLLSGQFQTQILQSWSSLLVRGAGSCVRSLLVT